MRSKESHGISAAPTVGEHRSQSRPQQLLNSKPRGSDGFLTTRRVIALFVLRLLMATVLQHCADVPDEWWQSTEVAYHNVFGRGHLPWEWNAELRSYIYPLPFDVVFRFLRDVGLDTPFLVWMMPKVIASLIACAVDVQTFRLGARLDVALGLDTRDRSGLTVGKVAFIFSVLHWFTGYIAVRTQSNVLEALLVVTALLQTNFLSFLFFAGFGCALRISCFVPLLPFALIHVVSTTQARGLAGLLTCAVEGLGMIGMWIGATVAIDYCFYQKLTFTPLNFLHFNVVKGHSAIFGTHPWHWYFSTAFPVVSLPFTLLHPLLVDRDLWRRLMRSASAGPTVALYIFTIVFTMGVYSLLPHKELRFFYPVVPLMLVLSALIFVHHPLLRTRVSSPVNTHRADVVLERPSRALFLLLGIVNILIYLIVSVGYRRGTIDVMSEVRSGHVYADERIIERLDVLTGCYATPGYSYVHARVKELRTIDCTPHVVNESTSETATTERDVFVEHPEAFVRWVYDGVSTGDKELDEKLHAVVAKGGSWPLPNVVIAYSYAVENMTKTFLERHGFVRHKSFYHTFYVFQPHEDLTIEIWKRE